MFSRVRRFYHRHQLFVLVLLLFVSFRLLAVLLFRPGGFVTDFSDYDFYRTWGQLTPAGYRVYDNLWTAYPPLFPALALRVWELSARIPPWVEPRLAFHTLLGLTLLVFETGNLVLIYRIAMKLEMGEPKFEIRERVQSADSPPSPLSLPPSSFLSPLLYALLFAPLYTMLGWFEPMPLFFLLLGLDLLLVDRRRVAVWCGSSVAAALGFLTKLTPAVLGPIAVRRLGVKLSWKAVQQEWFRSRSPGHVRDGLIFGLVFLTTVLLVGYPLVRANPDLALSSLRVQSMRPPWQSIWALLDGYFGYGLVPLDRRNLAGLGGSLWQSSLPWGLITFFFAAVYLWLYTRPYAWEAPRTPVAFAGFSVIWLFLYSKGWSPQFIVWILAFTVLLLPTLRGVAIAIVLMLTNFVEADVFLIMLPNQTGLLWGTVLVRTALLVLLAMEFIGQIWPGSGAFLRRWSGRLSWAGMAVALIVGIVSTPRIGNAYMGSRLAAHPCREAVDYLRAQAEWPTGVIMTGQSATWEMFYPWLWDEYDLHRVDPYRPREDPAQVVAEQLAAIGGAETSFWWLEWEGPGTPAPGDAARLADLYFDRADVQKIEEKQHGACRLSRVVQLPAQPLATVAVEGGPIDLLRLERDTARAGHSLHLVLYWQARAPVERSYTVFTQLLDTNNNIIAQQDNLPVEGLAPTDVWQPGVVIRDPYRLSLPAQMLPGDYRLLLGLYTGEGRQRIVLPDGTERDAVETSIGIEGR